MRGWRRRDPGGVRSGEEGERGHTVFGSSRAASAFCTGSWRTSGAMEVTCSRQAVYTLVTKSDEGRASCSLLTERPHSESAVMISGTGMFGNQYCPAMPECLLGLMVVMVRVAAITWSLIGRERCQTAIIRFIDLSSMSGADPPPKLPRKVVSRSSSAFFP